ncbi:MAG: hypothetical protein K6B28_10480 [Lachnospiraceae bacterium]|nr:hypothetical protein [Lachnospiraceae bacterium]
MCHTISEIIGDRGSVFRCRFKGMAVLMPCLIVMLMAPLLLLGCKGKADYKETLIRISKKGTIESEIYESFDKPYYNKTELESVINEEIDDFNALNSNEERVKLKETVVEDGSVSVTITYKSCSDYKEFNNVDFFVGTVNEARAQGYPMTLTMKSTGGGPNISEEDLNTMGESKIIIISEPVLVETPSDILYVTANIELVDENHARMSSDSSGKAYIIIK